MCDGGGDEVFSSCDPETVALLFKSILMVVTFSAFRPCNYVIGRELKNFKSDAYRVYCIPSVLSQ